MIARLAALPLAALPGLFPAVANAETRELGAHEHGHVALQIAVEGDAVEMILEAPGADIVGFEHAPETDGQTAEVEAALETLSDPMALFVLPDAAGCTVEAAEVELHQEGDHNAFEAEYTLRCADAAAVTEVGTKLFDLYPSIEEIEVEYATPAGQGAGELEPDDAVLSLPTS